MFYLYTVSYLEHGPSSDCSDSTAAVKNRPIEVCEKESDAEDLDVLQIEEDDDFFKIPETPGKNIVELQHIQSPLTPKINAIRESIVLPKIISPLQKTPTQPKETQQLKGSIKNRLGITLSPNKQTSAESYDIKTTPINTNKSNNTNTKQNTKTNTFKVVRSQSKKILKVPEVCVQKRTHSPTQEQQQLSTHPILGRLCNVQRHNFAQELKITVNNNNNNNSINNSSTANIIEKNVVDNFSRTPAEQHTKVITLNNKHVPKNVYLAIAVEKNKHLSKNALKKITRNLASQM